jgi:hypothetical protein
MIMYGGLLCCGICSTSIGLSNASKNEEQVETQKRIEQKLDKLLGMMNNE